MISSMTGFGEAVAEVDGVVYTVEIRSVNNRYFKPQIRLPDTASFLEGDIERLLRDRIIRGSINYSLRMKNISGQAFYDIDENALQSYISKLAGIAKSSDIHCQADLAGMLNLPGIVRPVEPDEEWSVKMKQTVTDLTNKAIDQLKQMRADEGKSLGEDLLSNCRIILEKVEQIKQRSPIVVTEYNEKLKKRADALLSTSGLKIDDETLTREVAVFADRCDIAEEIARLISHIQQFEKFCNGKDQAGRRLDFISQELLREANTIASKASDVRISQLVIDIKCAIDRIKEQVQNVE